MRHPADLTRHGDSMYTGIYCRCCNELFSGVTGKEKPSRCDYCRSYCNVNTSNSHPKRVGLSGQQEVK